MKKLVFLLLAVMMLTACGQDKENDQGVVYVNITAEEAKQIMDSEEGYIILDVRTQEEYDLTDMHALRLVTTDLYRPK